MPRVYRKARLTLAHWQLGHVCQALRGFWYFKDEQLSQADLQVLWTHLREPLLELHVRYYPGTRPHGWWCFESSQPRQRVDGRPHPFDNPHYPAHLKVLSYGTPRFLFVLGDEEEQYESQCTYLNRLGLLGAAEHRAFERHDWRLTWNQATEPHVPLQAIRAWWQEVTA